MSGPHSLYLPGPVGASLRLEAEHAAEAVEELAGADVARMGLEAGIVDARDGGMAPEKARQRESIHVLLADAQRERLQPAMEEHARVRIERAAEVVREV